MDAARTTIRVGGCRIGLEVARDAVPWGGNLEGGLRLEGKLPTRHSLYCTLELAATFGGLITVIHQQPLEVAAAHPGPLVPFSLPVVWAAADLGPGLLRAKLHGAAWELWPWRTLSHPVRFVAPPELERAAAFLAGLTGLRPSTTWRALDSGHSAVTWLMPGEGKGPFVGALMQVDRRPDADRWQIRFLLTESRVESFEADWSPDSPGCVEEWMRETFQSLCSGARWLPIPSDHSPPAGSLPLAAAPLPVAADLPRPSVVERPGQVDIDWAPEPPIR